MTDATKAPAPWDNPGTLPTDVAQQEAAKAAALAAASTPTTTPAPIAPATADSSAGSGTAVASQAPAPEVAKDVTVTVIVPKSYILRLSITDGKSVEHFEKKFEAGVQEMLYDDAVHSWSKANGVKVYVKS